MIRRMLFSGVLAVFVVATMFHFMWDHITHSTQGPMQIANEDFIEFVRIRPDSHLETRSRKLPEKPKEPEKSPEKPKLKIASDTPTTTPQVKMDIPKMSMSIKSGGPVMTAGGGASEDSEVMPIVRIEPQYPRKAAMTGQQGWVLLKFDITPSGSVEGVEVLDSQPRRIFNSAAKRALQKWKYRPKVIDGKAVSQSGNKVKIEFKLEG